MNTLAYIIYLFDYGACGIHLLPERAHLHPQPAAERCGADGLYQPNTTGGLLSPEPGICGPDDQHLGHDP